MRRVCLLTIIALLALAPALTAGSRGYSSGGTRHGSRATRSYSGATRSRSTARRSATRCATCARDSGGRISRSASAKHEFQKSHPCPATGKTSGPCKGYVIDHVVPLKRGGADSPRNMQWQTRAAAKAKDKIE
jgi:5-methylcytosine-specific restriction endonuclease McrA